METQVSLNEGQAVMKLAGRFDFNAHREYRAALDRLAALASVDAYVVDLSEVSYLDSSALGMLLLLRDRARQQNKPVTLAGVSGSVRQVLDIANFSKMFAITA